MSNFNKELFLNFLKKAREEAYTNERGAIKHNKLPGFSGRVYDDGRSRLTLLLAGIENTSYIEIGYRDKILVWNLTHHGRFLSGSTSSLYRLIDMQRFMMGILFFLKKAIGQPSAKHRVRGPESYKDQTMEYKCTQSSDTFPVTGVEKIFYQEKLVYEARFCAQWLRNN